jgi:hypothetical protein
LANSLEATVPDSFQKIDLAEFESETAKMPQGRLSPAKVEVVKSELNPQKIRERNLMGSVINEQDTEIDTTTNISSIELTYLTILDLYGKVLKNASFLEIDRRAKHVENFIDKWNLIIKNIIVKADEWLKLPDLSIELRNRVRFDLKVLAALLASKTMSEELANEELEPALKKIAVGQNRLEKYSAAPNKPRVNQLWAAFMLLDIRRQYNTVWPPLLRHYQNNRFFLTLMLQRLWTYYISTSLPLRERQRAANMIAELSISLGEPRQDKPRLVRRITEAGRVAAVPRPQAIAVPSEMRSQSMSTE